MRTFGAPCGLHALSVLFAFSSSFILLPPSTLRPPLLALGRPAPGPILPAVPHSAAHGCCIPPCAWSVSVRGAMRSLAFVGDFRAAEALYLPSGRALARILTASRQRRLILNLNPWPNLSLGRPNPPIGAPADRFVAGIRPRGACVMRMRSARRGCY